MSSDIPTPAATPAPAAAPAGAGAVVRRVVVFLLLFVLVSLAAGGIAGLLTRLFDAGTQIGDPLGGLAFPLTAAVIGGPLAVLLGWFAWRRLDGPDRASVAWGQYLAAMYVVSLITFSTAIVDLLSDAISGTWNPGALGTAVAWFAVWIIHRLMRANARKHPLRLPTVPIVLASAYGLIVMASGAIRALGGLFDEAFRPGAYLVGTAWWPGVLESLVWCAVGALVWVWHRMRDRAYDLRGGFADVILVLVGVFAAGAVALIGVGVTLYVVLRAAFDPSEGWTAIAAPLGVAVAAAAVGTVVWLTHRRHALQRGESACNATRLAEAGLGLIGAASGIGVIVNALLAGLVPQFAGDGSRGLLFAGIASLVVGAPVWWAAWHPERTAPDAGAVARRVYLVTVFGASAVVAVGALLTLGLRVFELTLGGDSAGGSLLERVRAPFGLLVATALVAIYHFAVWRRDAAAAGPAGRARTVDKVTLVAAAGADLAALRAAVTAATGASVTVWPRADVGADTGGVAPAVVAAALEGVSAHRVLVVVTGDRVEAIALQD